MLFNFFGKLSDINNFTFLFISKYLKSLSKEKIEKFKSISFVDIFFLMTMVSSFSLFNIKHFDTFGFSSHSSILKRLLSICVFLIFVLLNENVNSNRNQEPYQVWNLHPHQLRNSNPNQIRTSNPNHLRNLKNKQETIRLYYGQAYSPSTILHLAP